MGGGGGDREFEACSFLSYQMTTDNFMLYSYIQLF